MASLIDMITALITLLVSAAFLHFGAADDAVANPERPAAERTAMPANQSPASGRAAPANEKTAIRKDEDKHG